MNDQRTKWYQRIPRKLMATGVATGFVFLVACSSSVAPSKCIEAAEGAGLPAPVIEQLKKPGDLNALERIALKQALKRVGIDDLCDLGNS